MIGEPSAWRSPGGENDPDGAGIEEAIDDCFRGGSVVLARLSGPKSDFVDRWDIVRERRGSRLCEASRSSWLFPRTRGWPERVGVRVSFIGLGLRKVIATTYVGNYAVRGARDEIESGAEAVGLFLLEQKKTKRTKVRRYSGEDAFGGAKKCVADTPKVGGGGLKIAYIKVY